MAKKRIAILGPGTFSEESVHHFLGRDRYEYVPFKLISDVFLATASGETDYSVIPIENTIEGSVTLHIDWLVHEVDLPMQVEWVYPIDMNLIGLPGSAHRAADDKNGLARLENGELASSPPVSWSNITKVLSHSVALAQCRKFLRTYMPQAEIEQTGSNGESVRLVSELGDSNVVAIGTTNAADMYGMELLASKIQDNPDNSTRFILIGREKLDLPASGHTKTTILVTPPEDYPGALHQVLSAFAWRRINLSRLESRPTKRKLGKYYFYIDVEGSLESVLVRAAFEEIEAIGCQVRILGCYPTYQYETQTPEV
ncbi:prephenate dehydratase [Paenibacillus chitinolyticus]|uniref:Prephenate dehydratase n=1 Tax=Paenibacillus chitinolyticus TaxID=79263 RepID=A0A410X209_9BACL|nr:prephenate dehydratase domain-containing protein [Paenibacillus chitinolyticus]MCY9592726.1 prephenate dehydratase [Paenibacillus chitinolyticus]MCY9597432.1 prephenate dehydratase [Paenibacillus chitinolyticus]QAV20637.1 prephenate dehydratase [Paenibacillus chitinolyticus]